MKRGCRESLDLVNAAVAALRDGVGPWLLLLLAQRPELNPFTLALGLSLSTSLALAAPLPLALLCDRWRDRRPLLSAGALLAAAAIFLFARSGSALGFFGAQALWGLSLAAFRVSVPAVTLQQAPGERFGLRLSRNEVFGRLGTFFAVGALGFFAQSVAPSFALAAAYGLAGLVALLAWRLVPASVPASAASPPGGLGRWLRAPAYWRLVLLNVAAAAANAPLFTLFERQFLPTREGAAEYLAGALMLAQLVGMGAALSFARRRWIANSSLLLALGFTLVLARALIFAGGPGLFSLILGQLLGGGIAVLLVIVPLRALAQFGEAHFNFLAALLAAGTGLAAALSTLGTALLLEHAGPERAYLSLATVAFAGLLTALFFGFRYARPTKASVGSVYPRRWRVSGVPGAPARASR